MRNVHSLTCVPLAVCDMSFNSFKKHMPFYLFIYFLLHRFSHLAETFSNTNLLVPTRVFLSFVDMQDFYEYSFLYGFVKNK